MNVNVFCDECEESTEDGDDVTAVIMDLKGNLFFNPETKSQSQSYKCPRCGREVTVLITIPERTH